MRELGCCPVAEGIAAAVPAGAPVVAVAVVEGDTVAAAVVTVESPPCVVVHQS